MLSVSSQQRDTLNPDDSDQKDGAHEPVLWDGCGAAASSTSLEAQGWAQGHTCGGAPHLAALTLRLFMKRPRRVAGGRSP